jgi:hypothetical protein
VIGGGIIGDEEKREEVGVDGKERKGKRKEVKEGVKKRIEEKRRAGKEEN